ncbi:MAG: FAD-binding oxidoreductase, partial [Dehalococcoidia bacterium]|nr:FAD-binding oxidoreductase [Dehalococcoidia bacterium]
MQVFNGLGNIVGAANIVSDRGILLSRSTDHSIFGQGIPDCIVYAETPSQVRDVVRMANETLTPITPSSSGIHFNGNSLALKGGIVLDLSRMSKVLDIDPVHRIARIEPGVTWEQFQSVLELQGYRSVMPLFPHASRSVVTDWLEREQPTVHMTEYSEPMMSMHVVWGSGEELVTGSASINTFGKAGCLAIGTNPMGPGTISFWRFLQGAQGTIGIVTWCVVKVEPVPSVSWPFFLPLRRIEDAVTPLYLLLRRRLGYECFVVNNVDLALILSGLGYGKFDALRANLPAWTLVMVLGGLKRRPEEKVAYEREALFEIRDRHFPDVEIMTAIPGVEGLEHDLPGILRRPWPRNLPYWKHSWRGGCLDVTFMATLDKAHLFIDPLRSIAQSEGDGPEDIGC